MNELDLLHVDHWEDLPPGEWLEKDADGNHWFKDIWGNYWCSEGESYYNYSKTSSKPPQTSVDPITQKSNLYSETNQYTFDEDQEDEDKLQRLRREIRIKKALIKKYRNYRILAFLFVFILVVIGISVVGDLSSSQDLNCDQYDTWQQSTQRENCEMTENQVESGSTDIAIIILFAIMSPIVIKYLKWESKWHKKVKSWKTEIKKMKKEIKLLRTRD